MRFAACLRWHAVVVSALALTSCATEHGTIGAILGQDPGGRLTVRQVPANLGAARAGLKPGDQILLIDGIDVRTLDAQHLHELLGGEVGQPVKLTVLRGESVMRVTVRRTAAQRWRP
jgi:C-terminal processing protease CtpA/Prc